MAFGEIAALCWVVAEVLHLSPKSVTYTAVRLVPEYKSHQTYNDVTAKVVGKKKQNLILGLGFFLLLACPHCVYYKIAAGMSTMRSC